MNLQEAQQKANSYFIELKLTNTIEKYNILEFSVFL